jgi:hypothetical protein
VWRWVQRYGPEMEQTGSAIPDTKKEGTLWRRKQDHRAMKRRVNAKHCFREFQAA